jgi:hypothetical protein
MSRHSNVDGLGHYHDPQPRDTHLEEGLYMMMCEAVTNDEIDEWLDDSELPKTSANIDKAVREIALHRLGWDN